jgi:Tfp pilus assembly protein PilO
MKLVILITEEILLEKFIFTFLLGLLFIIFGYFFLKKDTKNSMIKTDTDENKYNSYYKKVNHHKNLIALILGFFLVILSVIFLYQYVTF